MSREIKFRAWTDSWGMVYFNTGGFTIDVQSKTVWKDTIDEECVELQQYTGLKDSTGREIYEGDILEELIQNESATQLGVCKQVLGGWRIFSLPDSKNYWHGWKQKVIGNIFETPELLA